MSNSLRFVKTRWLRTISFAMLVAAAATAFVFPVATAESPGDPKRVVFEVVDRNAEQIATVGDVLYYFGEPGMQEFESSKYLKATLEQIGFKVELGGAGLPTNVWATWGSGKPVIAIATEMDSLPEGSQTPGSIPRKPLVEGAPGHTEGHNVIAASVLDLLTSAELRAAAKKQFDQDTKDSKYFSLLPPGAKPPLDLNKEMMEKYRPAMRKFYLNKKAEFK